MKPAGEEFVAGEGATDGLHEGFGWGRKRRTITGRMTKTVAILDPIRKSATASTKLHEWRLCNALRPRRVNVEQPTVVGFFLEAGTVSQTLR